MNSSDEGEYSDKQFLDEFLPHLAEPCGPEGARLHAFYLGEAKKMLDEGRLQDAVQRERLRVAMLFARIDGARDTQTEYPELDEDLAEAERLFAEGTITDPVEFGRCRAVIHMAKILLRRAAD